MRWTFPSREPIHPAGATQAAPRHPSKRGGGRRAAIVVGVSLLITAASLPLTASALEPLKHATAVHIERLPEQGGAQVVVEFSAQPTYSARLANKGRRLLIDVANADITGAPAALTDRVGVVGGVMTQAFVTGRSKTTRILVTLLEDAGYQVSVDDRRLIIALRPGQSGALTGTGPAVTKRASQAAPSSDPVRVSDVRFEHAALEDRVIIDATAIPEYTKGASNERRATLVLRGAELPGVFERTLDVSAFGGPVTAISTYRSPGKAGRIVVEVERDGALDDHLVRKGHLLIWSFFKAGSLPSFVTGVGRDGGAARRAHTLQSVDNVADVPRVTTHFTEGAVTEDVLQPERAAAFGAPVLGQAAGRYTGRRVDLDLKDADIHNVLRLLADVGHVNIITSDDVQGTVTIKVRNIPWDQALDTVLQSKKLGMVRQGNIIRVAPIEQLEKERELAIARAKQEMQLAPVETRLIPVSYAQAGEIQARARDLLSPRGTIAVDDRTNVLIVRDVAGNLDQIEELIRSLDTQTPQVLVEARIVEATSRYLRDIGIQWGGDATFSPATGNPTGLAFPNRIGIVGGASDNDTPTQGLSPFQSTVPNPNFAVNLPAAVGTGSGGAIGLTFGSVDNNFNLALRLSAAESSGMLRILSSPRILTLDNSEARISQGTLIPFSQVSAQGVQTTFQEAKLQLLVRPHVTADGSIAMHVKINRDEPDFNQTSARGDPTILKREAETDLLVMDGNTAVIGGIYTRNTGRNLDQVPFFGDIPILGLLFQKRRASDTRGELVIFLTPRIVNRAEALGR